MADLKQEFIQEQKTSLFTSSKELLELNVLRLINSKDYFECWYLKDFLKLGSYQNVRKALKSLTSKNYIKEFKSFPVYWQRIKESDDGVQIYN